MNINYVKQFCTNVNGWLSDKEGEFLYNSAKNSVKGGVIVEIGSWQGKSTIYLGWGSKNGNGNHIYAIDPHIGSSEHQISDQKIWTFEKFKENIKNAELNDIVTPIVLTSEEANKGWDLPISLLWIDGAHEYEYVKKDFELWSPFLVEGGIIAFHDNNYPDVKKLTSETISINKTFVNLRDVDSILSATKDSSSTLLNKKIEFYLIYIKKLSKKIYLHFIYLKGILYQKVISKNTFLERTWKNFKSVVKQLE